MALNVTVTLKDKADPIDVKILNPDRVRWDMTAQKHNWPAFQDAPFLGTTFLAWAALRRENLYAGTFEEFRDRDALDVESWDDTEDTATDDAIEGLGNPTL